MTRYEKAMVIASEFYLTQPLPADFQTMSNRQYNAYLLEHVWEPFQNKPVGLIHDCIEQLANTFIEVEEYGL